MPVWRLQCAWQYDTTFPADSLVITPHFRDDDLLTSPQELCDDLADALGTWDAGTPQLVVKAYDAQGTPPVYPQGEARRNEPNAPASTGVRETAICLSYFSHQNRPRYRGRLYIPTTAAGINTGASRPSLANRSKIGELATIFADLGGTEVDWCVYSRVDDEARPVTNWWVDDAWDHIRKRGLRPTTRLEGTTSED
jgi:hypothetical protein